MYVTTVRGRRYENILIRKFNGRKFFDMKISQITVILIAGAVEYVIMVFTLLKFCIRLFKVVHVYIIIDFKMKQNLWELIQLGNTDILHSIVCIMVPTVQLLLFLEHHVQLTNKCLKAFLKIISTKKAFKLDIHGIPRLLLP